MPERPRALMLAPEAPYPVVGGGPLRTASVLEYLAQSFTLEVIVFREPGAPDPRSRFPPGLVRRVDVVDLPYHGKDTLSRAARNFHRFVRGAPPLVDRFSGFDSELRALLNGRSYDIGVVEHFWCARYGRVLREFCGRLWLNLHNIESVLLERCAETENWAGAAAMVRFANACRKLEQIWLRDFDRLLVTSRSDQAHASALAPGVKSLVYPNAIPFVRLPDRAKGNSIVFSGNLDYHPNASAVRFFFDEVWSYLQERWPRLQWRIVGKNPQALPERIAGSRSVHVVGPVENAVESIAESKCAVAPVIAGSGTRVKIIEAWAAGLPVVSTSVGAEGLPGIPGQHFLVADTPPDLVKAISAVLESPDLAENLGKHGRQLYESELTWTAAWKTLAQAGI